MTHKLRTAALLALGLAVTLAVLLPGWLSEGDRQPSAAVLAATQVPSASLTAESQPGALASSKVVMGAPQLRLLLERQLGEHALVMAGASADAADGEAVSEVLAALERSTAELASSVGLVYGEVAGRAFTSLWTQHVAFFIDRAVAAGLNDGAGLLQADGHLHHYERDFGTFVATATDRVLPAEVVTLLLEGHVSDINGFVGAHLAADGESAASSITAGHRRVADIGAGLATAIAEQAPVAFPGDAAGADVEGPVGLARHLAAHLAVSSLEHDAPDARAAAQRSLLAAFAQVAADPAVTRTAASAWLGADVIDADTAAEALAETLAVNDPAQVAHDLGDYRRGLGSGLLDPVTEQAHDAAYAVAGALLGP